MKAIEVRDLSKQYRLGLVGSGTLRDDIHRWWSQLRGKDNPLLKVGELNDHSQSAESSYVWSLKDVNFEVEQGEVLGIVGKNGAGKSTLLKILSKVTAPTTGTVKTRGRVASLLEVGTGFHPELTGKENIFLNGAILGMRKSEIKRKFDEIVHFSGVERYIDTPVKRYSSGMYVRLAFAVAAHLESEILIVDEVLAVGDAEFQKKCLGKMESISNSFGKTILFVSHNAEAVNKLCTSALWLENGAVKNLGEVTAVLEQYLSQENSFKHELSFKENSLSCGDDLVELIFVEVIDKTGNSKGVFTRDDEVGVRIIFEVKRDLADLNTGINLFNTRGNHIFSSHDGVNAGRFYAKGSYSVVVRIPKLILKEGSYSLGIALMSYKPFVIRANNENLVGFTITSMSVLASLDSSKYNGEVPGLVHPELGWELVKEEVT